jgi:hypothetical protein
MPIMFPGKKERQRLQTEMIAIMRADIDEEVGEGAPDPVSEWESDGRDRRDTEHRGMNPRRASEPAADLGEKAASSFA